MEKLVEYIVSALVDDKDAVKVSGVQDGDAYIITVKTSPEEVGRVVGKNGKNAQAIRTIIRSLAGKQGFSDKKYIVKFEWNRKAINLPFAYKRRKNEKSSWRNFKAPRHSWRSKD